MNDALSPRLASLDELKQSITTGALTGYRVSPRALHPHGTVRGALPDGLTLDACVAAGGEHQLIAAGADHVVVNRRIHALGAETRRSWRGWAEDHKVRLGQPLSLRKFLELLADPNACQSLHTAVSSSDGWNEAGATQPPRELNAKLYPYQLAGYATLKALADRNIGGILADEMGLGKTVQAIALLASQKAQGTSLVVAPAALLTNWAREVKTFAPTLSMAEHAGPDRAGVLSGIPPVDVVLTTYETVVRDLSFLKDRDWNLVVLDEAQRIKNPDATRADSVKQLPVRVPLCVTGTPVENRLTDLWSLSQFVLPELLGSLIDFQSAFPDEDASARALGALVAPLTVRRKVSDVAKDLPERIDRVVAIDQSLEARHEYEAVAMANPGLPGHTQLRLMAAHADAESQAGFSETPKVRVAVAMLDEIVARNEKALVFASFKVPLDSLETLFNSRFPRAFSAVIDGRTSPRGRQSLIDHFESLEGAAALFLNPNAAGVGLNITAANHVLHFNPEWNPAVTEQATARAYRRRQERTVVVQHLFYANTVEEDAVETAQRKRSLAQAVDVGYEDRGNQGKATRA